jgi:hypothetical protein
VPIARALHDLLARYHNPHLQRPKIKRQKKVCQNLSMGQSYEHRIIFLPVITCLDFSKYGHILGKTLCSSHHHHVLGTGPRDPP